jgi:hypothetical protein
MTTPNEDCTKLNITIQNVHTFHPHALAIWVDHTFLSTRLPDISPSHIFDAKTELVPLLSSMSNKLAFCTELYNMIVGHLVDAKINSRKVKSSMPVGNDYDQYAARLEANKEILHRTMMSVTNQYEAVSRIMTGISFGEKLLR